MHGVGVPREAEEEREEAAERGTRRNGVAAAMRVHGPRLFFSEFFFACGPAARAWEMKTQSGLGWARVYLTAGNRLDRSNRPYHRGSVGVTDRFLIKSNLLN